MKTAEEQFEKYATFVVTHADMPVLTFGEYVKAYEDSRNEIKELIDDLEPEERIELTDQQFDLYAEGFGKAVDELKNKLGL